MSFLVAPADAQHMHGQTETSVDSTQARNTMHGSIMRNGQHMTNGQNTMNGQGTMYGQYMMNGQGMMQMMHEVMDNPLTRESALARVLPDMQKELNLSESEVSNLDASRTRYLQKQADLESQIASLWTKLNGLLQDERTSPDQVTSQLNQIAATRAEFAGLGYVTARSMVASLPQEARDRLAALSPAQLQRQMMTDMNLMQMNSVMQSGSMSMLDCGVTHDQGGGAVDNGRAG